MDKIFFTVGPTQIYPTVSTHLTEALSLGIPSMSHRGTQFTDMYAATAASLKKLMNVPADFETFFLSSGTEAMERVVQNCSAERTAHVVYGSFSKRWRTIADQLGRKTEALVVTEGEVPDLGSAAFSNEPELVCVTQNETSTGGMIPVQSLKTLREKYPDAILAVDIVSSAPVVILDWSVTDVGFFSVQKGFGLPAGLAVVFVSPRAYAKSLDLGKRISIGSFHAFPELKKYADKNQTPETPNVLDIYLLGKVTDDLLKEGIENIRMKIENRAKRIYEFLEKSSYTPFIKNANGRSLTTLAAEVPGGSKLLIESIKAKGFVIGSGYGAFKEAHIRIGNFPAHFDKDVERLIMAFP